MAVLTATGTLVSVVLKDQFDRPRPQLVPHETQVFTASFPSGHSAMSALFLLTLGAAVAAAQRRRTATVYMVAVAAALALLIGASRVYLGVHWPTDVLAGWTFGIAWAAGGWWIYRFRQRRRTQRATAGLEPAKRLPEV